MSNPLLSSDYKKILTFYNIPIPSNKKDLQKKAEDILSEKLCKCIKKVDPTNEEKSIGICTKTILNNRGLSRGIFSCKKKRSIVLKKTKKILFKNKNKKTKRM